MGQILHGSATTTHAVRAAIQRSQASATELSRTYGINPKTVLKWRKRATVEDRGVCAGCWTLWRFFEQRGRRGSPISPISIRRA